MTTYQELYELERKRADMCEGIILELRRQLLSIEIKASEMEDSRSFWMNRTKELVDEKNALKRERRELRKALAAAKQPPTP